MIVIRKLSTMQEMEAVHQLEIAIWESEIVPTHQTMTVARNGGLLLGAYDGKSLIGFSYSFPAYKDGKLYLCSHMLGVLPAYRSHGVGEQLKRQQQKEALALGYDRIQWTFDPLETRNAYLNLTKLGGISGLYMENAYGNLQDGLNDGLPTDRLEVTWHIDQAIQSVQLPKACPILSLNDTTVEKGLYLPISLPEQALSKEAIYRLFITDDFQMIKEKSKTAAETWRYHTRRKFQQLFAAGFIAVKLERISAGLCTYYFIHKKYIDR